MFVHSIATKDNTSISHGLKILSSIPEKGQWANFLRIHDELNLEWLTESQRQDIFEAFAPQEEMRIYDRGVRRRLAPMLNGNTRRIRMAMSLIFTLPGTPLIYYGEEIGMGDDLSLEGRETVRTPMQWADEDNAGFSSAPADELVTPVIDDGPYSYTEVNVDDQHFDDNSLLSYVEQFIRTRKEHPEIGWGNFETIDVDAHETFAHQYTWKNRIFIAIHNLCDESRTVSIEVDAGA